MNASDSIVIIPTYNERENIEKIIKAVFGLEKCFHILIIDDGSPDGTAGIVKGLMAQQEYADRLFIIERSGKQGWSQRCELAYRARTDVLFRLQICARGDWLQGS